MSASRGYKVRPYPLRTHDVTVCSEGGARRGGAWRWGARRGRGGTWNPVYINQDL